MPPRLTLGRRAGRGDRATSRASAPGPYDDRGAAVVGLVVVLLLTAPSRSGRPARRGRPRSTRSTPPSTAAGQPRRGLRSASCCSALGAAMGSGGGRELMPRSEAAIHPISPTTEHLGALVLAPLNLGLAGPAVGLLAVTALVRPPDRLLGAQLVVLAWVLAATASARRSAGRSRASAGPRTASSSYASPPASWSSPSPALHLAGVADAARRASLPTTWLADVAQTPRWPRRRCSCCWRSSSRRRGRRASARVGARAAAARGAARRVRRPRGAPRPRAPLGLARPCAAAPPRPRLGLALGRHAARTAGARPRSRPDRARRRAGVGLGDAAPRPHRERRRAALRRERLVPRRQGDVWRETLPVSDADVSTYAPSWSPSAWPRSPASPSCCPRCATACRRWSPVSRCATCWLVVLVQVLAIVMTWSMRSPYAVDLASPRATPAPHAAMAAYAGKLSLVTDADRHALHRRRRHAVGLAPAGRRRCRSWRGRASGSAAPGGAGWRRPSGRAWC